MNFRQNNPSSRNAAWRRLPIEWLEPGECPDWEPAAGQKPIFGGLRLQHPRAVPHSLFKPRTLDGPSYGSTETELPRRQSAGPFRGLSRPTRLKRAFTLLEMMLVIAIIGIMAAMALPHLAGFTKGSAMTAATRQLLDDVTYARQRALVNRSMVCMVFLPADFWTNEFLTNFGSGVNTGYQRSNPWRDAETTNLAAHQYSAYALISMRTVGDQPGVSNAQYLTDWKYLPKGIYISPFQLTNSPSASNPATNWVWTTNTLTSVTNPWNICGFPTTGPAAIAFPFPSTYGATYTEEALQNSYDTFFAYLPYIAFAPDGQLTTNEDQFILLTSGSIFPRLDPNGLPSITYPAAAVPDVVETPPGNAFSNPNIIHIDWLTGRAKLERNQF